MNKNRLSEVIVAVRALKKVRGVTVQDVKKFLSLRGLRVANRTVKRGLQEATNLGFLYKHSGKFLPLRLQNGPQLLRVRRRRRGKIVKPKCPCFSKARYRYRSWSTRNRYRRRRVANDRSSTYYRRKMLPSRRRYLSRRQPTMEDKLNNEHAAVGVQHRSRMYRKGRQIKRRNFREVKHQTANLGLHVELGNHQANLERSIKVEIDPDNVPSDDKTPSNENIAKPNSETSNENKGASNENKGENKSGQDEKTNNNEDEDKDVSSEADENTKDNSEKGSSHSNENDNENEESNEQEMDVDENEYDVEAKESWPYNDMYE